MKLQQLRTSQLHRTAQLHRQAPQPGDPAVTGVFVGAEATFGFDIDNDNKPDVLDFDGVQQLYAKTDGAKLSGTVPFMV